MGGMTNLCNASSHDYDHLTGLRNLSTHIGAKDIRLLHRGFQNATSVKENASTSHSLKRFGLFFWVVITERKHMGDQTSRQTRIDASQFSTKKESPQEAPSWAQTHDLLVGMRVLDSKGTSSLRLPWYIIVTISIQSRS